MLAYKRAVLLWTKHLTTNPKLAHCSTEKRELEVT